MEESFHQHWFFHPPGLGIYGLDRRSARAVYEKKNGEMRNYILTKKQGWV